MCTLGIIHSDKKKRKEIKSRISDFFLSLKLDKISIEYPAELHSDNLSCIMQGTVDLTAVPAFFSSDFFSSFNFLISKEA